MSMEEEENLAISRLLQLPTTKAPNLVVPPAVPSMDIFPPPAARVKSPGPSKVFKKEIFRDAAAVEIEVSSAIVTGPEKETSLPIVEVLAKETAPLPDCVQFPSIDSVAVLAKVAVPVFAIVKGPPFVVVIELLKAKAAPVKLMPDTLVVDKAPLKVVVPVPAD
jgi:hypothetical protein